MRPGGVEVLAIEILDVRGDVGRAPGDELVASERDRRRAGKRAADDVEVAGGHVREVPGGRQPRAEMRIVGEQRLAGRRHRAVDDPVVGPEPFGARAAEQKVADGRVAAERRRRTRSTSTAYHALTESLSDTEDTGTSFC